MKRIFAKLGLTGAMALVAGTMASCGTTGGNQVVVSVKDQSVALMRDGKPVRVYPCSTSKFCIGDQPGSYGTPLGNLRIASKIGARQPLGMVFKGRRPTGEILPPNAPGRDPIVTRIMRLKGTESKNRQAFSRHIYIHGTPEEWTIGRPASFGCVRMRSRDVADLFDRVAVGTPVVITKSGLPGEARRLARHQVELPPTVVGPMPPDYGAARKGAVVNRTEKFGPTVR